MAAGSGLARSRERSQNMAKWLVERGYWHGKRASVTHAPCVPDPTQVGSAAYRRRQAKLTDK